LPPVLVISLGLPLVYSASANLADGCQATFDVYRVTVLWDGRPRQVDAYLADTAPLVAMRMLKQHGLFIEVQEGGRVLIQARE